MAAAKDSSVKVQLNLKRGDDMLNVYATNARELDALVTEIVDVSPALATRFGLKKSVAAAEVAAEPAEVTPNVSRSDGDGSGAQVEAQAEQASAAAAPTSTDGEALSPREKARLRLKGGK